MKIIATGIKNAEIRMPEYIKQHPYVGEEGIFMPVKEYVREDECPTYRMVLSREMFVEAYNKWIKGEQND